LFGTSGVDEYVNPQVISSWGQWSWQPAQPLTMNKNAPESAGNLTHFQGRQASQHG